jgi:hypothetical protein
MVVLPEAGVLFAWNLVIKLRLQEGEPFSQERDAATKGYFNEDLLFQSILYLV